MRSLRVLLGPPHSLPPYPTPLVEKCETALETPLGELSGEQLRLLIGQKFGLDLLVPKALDLLEVRPLLAVTFFEGDLLKACLTAPASFWADNPCLWDRLYGITRKVILDDPMLASAFQGFEAVRGVET